MSYQLLLFPILYSFFLVKELQQTLNSDDKSDEPGEKAIPDSVSLPPLPPPPPPPPPPPLPPTTVTKYEKLKP